MGIILICIAAAFAATSNFFMRRSIDAGGTTKAFLMILFLIACVVSILLNPVRTSHYEWNSFMVQFGLFSGLLFGLFMFFLGKALENGPPGLTFAILNASTILPAIFMSLLFISFGYTYTYFHAIGSFFVLLGLFWAGWQLTGIQNKIRWSIFILSSFALHALYLVLMQWRALLIQFPNAEETFSVSATHAQCQWFLPATFFAAAVFQICNFFLSEKRLPFKKEYIYGSLGGVANSLATFFLIWSTEVANTIESAMLFPIFSVMIIVLCNIWGSKIYDEKVNWKACQICIAGLLIGTADWSKITDLFF